MVYFVYMGGCMVFGYKCFNKDLTNRYGFKFDVGKTYGVSGEIKFGINGNGFHMCKNIEDTFRYYDAMEGEVSVCEVIGLGEFVSLYDEYNGYYDMYSVEMIEIIRLLSREDIIEMALNFSEERVIRFIQLYRLTSSEIILFKEKFKKYSRVIDNIIYYQEGDMDIFSRKLIR